MLFSITGNTDTSCSHRMPVCYYVNALRNETLNYEGSKIVNPTCELCPSNCGGIQGKVDPRCPPSDAPKEKLTVTPDNR